MNHFPAWQVVCIGYLAFPRRTTAPGVSIGDNSIIGAGSVVTKNIPANVVAVGNPCKVIRELTEDERK